MEYRSCCNLQNFGESSRYNAKKYMDAWKYEILFLVLNGISQSFSLMSYVISCSAFEKCVIFPHTPCIILYLNNDRDALKLKDIISETLKNMTSNIDFGSSIEIIFLFPREIFNHQMVEKLEKSQ